MERFKIVKQLGAGGNSSAYLAIDKESGKKVTIKKAIKEGTSIDIHRLKALETEGQILSQLKHRAIPQVFYRGRDMLALEYIPGESLEKVIMAKGTFSEKEAVRIALEIAGILRYLHGKREVVIYRDLKPANIVLRPDGHMALIDFGAARIYSKGCKKDTTNLGTLGFAAPEQFGNLGQTDPRTDIYCFGMTLLQMISGVDPKDSDAVSLYKQNGVKGVSRELISIIDKCTRPDREDRFLSVKEVEEALKTYPELIKKRKLISRVKTSLAAAGMAAVIALCVTCGALYADKIKAYAASDMEVRLPAVNERLYTVRQRIEEFVLSVEDKIEESIR